MAARDAAAGGHWWQALRIAFVAFYICTLIAAARWLAGNVRQVGAGERAVVLHFGAIAREQDSGLLWAWPQPVDEVLLVPAAETVLERQVQALLRSQRALNADLMVYDDYEGGPVSDELAGSGYLLTGDSAIAQLDVRVFYRVTEPRAYVLQREHVLPALDRLTTGSAVAVCAGRDLDTILVARPELVAASAGASELREQLRHDLLNALNGALGRLRRNGLELGIEVLRVDVQSALPRDTLPAFNAVLTASQAAEQAVAEARSHAAGILQQATQAADRTLQVARALASERVARAQADTASVAHLAASVRQGTEPGLLLRVYRERLPGILQQAGEVTTVDTHNDPHLIIPAARR